MHLQHTAARARVVLVVSIVFVSTNLQVQLASIERKEGHMTDFGFALLPSSL